MLYEKPPFPSLDSHAHLIAERAAISALLRSFCREIGVRQSLVAMLPPQPHGPFPAPLRRAPEILQIVMTEARDTILIGVQAASATQDYLFCTSPYRRHGRRFEAIDWRQLARMIYATTARLLDAPANEEILDQTANSVAITTRLVAHRLAHPVAIDGTRGMADYLRSEGGLIFGHALHPTPKSRQGIEIGLMARYSPETGCPFDLNYVAVRRDRLWTRAADTTTAVERIARCLPPGLIDDEWVSLPVHPIQAQKLRRTSAMALAIRSGWLRDLGVIPKAYHATSSVRTLFDPGDPFFLKLSLDIRMTNCVRKNAEYELEGAVAATCLIRERKAEFALAFPDCIILEEPASLSAEAPASWSAQDRRTLIEGLGLILRQSLVPFTPADVTPIVAGALFSPGIGNENSGLRIIRGATPATDIADWFGSYVRLLLPPVLYGYFHQGVIFEPHLQNVVVGLRLRRPSHVYLRDFEGVKITGLAAVPAFNDLGARAREALSYTADQGWCRIAYCLFVNNFCEAIHQLSQGDRTLVALLWDEVASAIAAFQRDYGTQESQDRLIPLLRGAPFPAKTMLTTRFQRRADRESGYVDLVNPMGA
jgi:siderophore synthetase component